MLLLIDKVSTNTRENVSTKLRVGQRKDEHNSVRLQNARRFQILLIINVLIIVCLLIKRANNQETTF